MTAPRQQPRAGFAAIFAITLIILVAMTLATVATYFVNDARRTRAAAEDAQLRQLLLAGAIAALNDPAKMQVDLPAELENAKVTLSREDHGEAASVHIVAQLGKRQMEQTLELTRADNRWKLRHVTLD